MPDSERLTTGQRRFALAVLESKSIRQACEIAGVSEATGYRYLQAPAVKRRLSQYTDGMLAQAATGLLADMELARQTLREIMQDTTAADTAKVSAARTVLDSGLRLAELVSLVDRVAELESRLEVSDGPFTR